MKKISAKKKLRRNVLDNITRIAADGLKQGEHTADILVAILAEINGQSAGSKKLSKATKKKVGRPKKKVGRPKKPGPKPKKGRKKPGPKPKKGRKTAKLAGKKATKTIKARNPKKPPHGYIKKAVARGIKGGRTSREILTALKKKYPDSTTSINTISFYKKNLTKPT